MFERLVKRLFPGRANRNDNDGLGATEPKAASASQGHGALPSAPIAVATMPQPEPSRKPFETNAFRFREAVMDDLYPDLIAQYGETTDSLVIGACRELSREYSALSRGAAVSYESPLRRLAFLYVWEAIHARQLQNVLSRCEDVHSLFERDRVNVVCIGGGPGTELHGIADFLARSDKNVTVSAMICDKEQGWDDCRTRIVERIRDHFNVEMEYVDLDIRDARTWTSGLSSLQGELYVMSYLVSEVCVGMGASPEFFSRLYTDAAPESFFLVIDGNYASYKRWLDALPLGWIIQQAAINPGVKWSNEEESAARDHYHGRLKAFQPQRWPTCFFRLYRKP